MTNEVAVNKRDGLTFNSILFRAIICRAKGEEDKCKQRCRGETKRSVEKLLSEQKRYITSMFTTTKN